MKSSMLEVGVGLDLKPDNILLTRAGRVVLIDFGAAKQETGREQGTGNREQGEGNRGTGNRGRQS
ncbi:MAG: hypothetical protein EBE86_029465, partial [Hormoscilla sp. GUM202]|nr:hypothetical protein [Hormoscilla sp. GUM202]